MRYLFTTICFLMFAAASAQNSFIVDKKGNKTIVRDDALGIINIDNRVQYKLVGKTWEKFITYKDLDYVQAGDKLFKSFRLDGKKKDKGYFILADDGQKKLICIMVTVSYTSPSGHMGSSTTYYEARVIDNDNNTIEKLEFTSARNNDDRAKAAPFVKKYFSGCPDLMKRLADYDYAIDKDASIMDFFDNQVYIKCQ